MAIDPPTRPEGAKHAPKHTPSKRKKGFFRRFWWVFVLVPLLVVAALAGSLYVAYARIQLPDALPPIRTSYLYDRNGTLLTPLHGAVDRKIVGLNQISKNLQHAILATEDAGFYEHPGIDVRGIISAAWTDLVKRDTVVGASTITQQLVKNVYAGEYVEHPNGVPEYIVPPRTVKEKVREALLAIKVEQELSKDQILAKYLNTVYFGHGAYGAEAAAQTYFDVAASELTVMQSAVLAAVLHAPSLYDPIKSKFDNKFRRDYTLDQMAKYGYITADDARRMKEERCCGIDPEQRDAETRISSPGGSEYFVEWTRSRLFKKYGSAAVYGGGLQITTTLDLDLQEEAEKAVNEYLPAFNEFSDVRNPDAALVTIDNATGEVLAMVGGRNWNRSKLNLATLPCEGCGRQAGSAFKPFTLTAALENDFALTGHYWSGPSTITIDNSRCDGPEGSWTPTNAGDSSAGSAVTLLAATTNSVNTVYAQLIAAWNDGPDDVIDAAHRLGIRSELPSVCSITLGSVQINPLEMTNAYATLANQGRFNLASPLHEVRRSNGTPITRTPGEATEQPACDALLPRGCVIDANIANQVTYALTSVVEGGTGTAAAVPDFPVAGKTGSAQDNVDAWFCGYTVQLSTCVWVGYPDAQEPLINIEGVPTVYGGTIPAVIFSEFMTAAMDLYEYPAKSFPDYELTGTLGAPTPVSSPAPPPPPSPSETTPSETPPSETPPSETPPSPTP